MYIHSVYHVQGPYLILFFAQNRLINTKKGTFWSPCIPLRHFKNGGNVFFKAGFLPVNPLPIAVKLPDMLIII